MEPELFDLLKFLVEYLILYPVAFDLLNEFIYQLLRVLSLPKLLGWIRNKSHKLAVNREDLKNFQQVVTSPVLTHYFINTDPKIFSVISQDQETCSTGNLGNHQQATDSNMLKPCSSLKEIQDALDTALKRAHVPHAVDPSSREKQCKKDAPMPNSGRTKIRITPNLHSTKFMPSLKLPYASDKSKCTELLQSENAQERIPETSPFSIVSSNNESTSADQLISNMVSESERSLSRPPSNLPFNCFNIGCDSMPTSQLDISTMESDSRKTLTRTISTSNFSSFSPKTESISPNIANFPAPSQSVIEAHTINSLEYEDSAPNGANDCRLQMHLGYESKELSSYQVYQQRTRQLDADSTSLYTDMMELSETKPSDELASVDVTSDLACSGKFSIKYESVAPNTAGDLIPERAVKRFKLRRSRNCSTVDRLKNVSPVDWGPGIALANSNREMKSTDGLANTDAISSSAKPESHREVENLARNVVGHSKPEKTTFTHKLRSGRVYSASGKLEDAVAMDQTTTTASTNLSHQKVRRTRSLGDSPTPKRRCCLRDWYGDRYRRRCDELIPEVVQRYGRPSSFVTSYFSSTLAAARLLVPSNSATSSVNSSNIRNAASSSAHSAPTSANSVSTSGSSDSSFLPHLYQ